MAEAVLGYASGGEPSFWEKLGTDLNGHPIHYPLGVDRRGRRPMDGLPFMYVCACGDLECPLTLTLGHARRSGVRNIKITM